MRSSTASILAVTLGLLLGSPGAGRSAPPADGALMKRIVDRDAAGPNRLTDAGWRPYETGFERGADGSFTCDNGGDAKGRRGLSQTVTLNQATPQPIVASAWSRATGVTGGRDNDYSLYLDLLYTDGTPLWGQTAAFSTGTHAGERREVLVLPEKPVRSVTVHLLLRGHGGRADFRDARLGVLEAPAGSVIFDGVPVTDVAPPSAGFQVRDVAAGSGFVRLEREAIGLRLDAPRSLTGGVEFVDATLEDTGGRDRAVTLVHAWPVDGDGWEWLAGCDKAEPAAPGREYVHAARASAGTGRLSLYPFAAIRRGGRGMAVGIDMDRPAVFRTGYNAATREIFVAFDLGLAPEKPGARLRVCAFAFDPEWGFRAALERYHGIFPDHFRVRVPRQGVWMPFAKISAVPAWEDFGFAFKEGNDETAWDDSHGILTFRYTEPMTWWMRMPGDMPRTIEAALAEARRLASAPGNPSVRSAAEAFLTSGFHDESGSPPAQLRDTPWCDGAVWSMNSAPGVPGDVTDFKNKWNPRLRETLYGDSRRGDLDGEYIDSSEGYVTDPLDSRRDHFAGAEAPLTFSPVSHRPAVFRGLIAWEYVRAIARDVHGMGRLMMANGTPHRLCWLAPMLDVMGTETDWNPPGGWRPMPFDELLYRRALCGGKPYCFLMNTRFEHFPAALTEKFMQRSLACGMFPGFFSADASTGHYFTRPELFERDRALFRKYVPLCRLVAEAGWEPVTRARAGDPRVRIERFGGRYLTVFNDSPESQSLVLSLEHDPPTARAVDRVTGGAIPWSGRDARMTLPAESVAVLDLRP